MTRFPKHYHEGAEKPLRCFQCDNILTEAEDDAYWQNNPHGEGEPSCFECASMLALTDFPDKPFKGQKRWVSLGLFGWGAFFIAMVVLYPDHAGYYLLAAVGCGSVGMFAWICRL